MKMIEVSEDALNSIKAMAEKDAKDAARYRWLRKSHPDVEPEVFVGKDSMNGWGRTSTKILRNSELDKFIDKAIQ